MGLDSHSCLGLRVGKYDAIVNLVMVSIVLCQFLTRALGSLIGLLLSCWLRLQMIGTCFLPCFSMGDSLRGVTALVADIVVHW